MNQMCEAVIRIEWNGRSLSWSRCQEGGLTTAWSPIPLCHKHSAWRGPFMSNVVAANDALAAPPVAEAWLSDAK